MAERLLARSPDSSCSSREAVARRWGSAGSGLPPNPFPGVEREQMAWESSGGRGGGTFSFSETAFLEAEENALGGMQGEEEGVGSVDDGLGHGCRCDMTGQLGGGRSGGEEGGVNDCRSTDRSLLPRELL